MITKGEMTPQAVKGFEGENKKRSWAGKGSDFLNLSANTLRKGFKMLQQGGAFIMAAAPHSKRIEEILKIGTMQNLNGVKARLAAVKPAELPVAKIAKVGDKTKLPFRRGKELE